MRTLSAAQKEITTRESTRGWEPMKPDHNRQLRSRTRNRFAPSSASTSPVLRTLSNLLSALSLLVRGGLFAQSIRYRFAGVHTPLRSVTPRGGYKRSTPDRGKGKNLGDNEMTNQREIQCWSIEKLIPYIRNPRKNDAAVDRMAASMREFGFKIPILVRADGEVIDGHLRVKAARKLGISEIPVILCDEWTPAQVKAFRLMANRSVTWADWDEELLALELQDIQSADFDLALTGFDAKELDDLLAHDDDQKANDVRPLPESPGTLVVTGVNGDSSGIKGALTFETRVRVLAQGGHSAVDAQTVSVDGADSATLLIAAATSYKSYKDVSGDPRAATKQTLAAAEKKPFDALLRAHIKEHQRLFHRVQLDLGTTAEAKKPTDERIRDFSRRRRSATGGALLPVRSVSPGIQFPSRRPARQSAGHLEREHESALGKQVHDQHQYRDELLARRAGQSRRVRGPVDRDGHGSYRHRRAHRKGNVQRTGLGGAPQYRSMESVGSHRRRALWNVAYGRRVALPASLGSLRLQR